MPSYVVAAITTVLLTAPAIAGPCELDIKRAPEDVKRAIETRTGRHLECARLTVRIVTQDDGLLYALAIAPDGTVREQAFADAPEAATQIVAWAVEATPRRRAPAVAASTEAAADQRVTAVAAPRERRDRRWIALSGIVNPYSRGIRGELDLVVRSGWIVGLSAGLSSAKLEYSVSPMRELAIGDLRGLLGVTRAFDLGTWQLRARAGIGVVSSDVAGLDDRDQPITGTATTAVGEASLQISYLINQSWAIGAGALFTYYGQQLELPDGAAVFRELDTVAIATVQRRL